MEIIPAINCLDKTCVKEKLNLVKKFGGWFKKSPKWIHIDYADSRFTFNKTWGTAKDIKDFDQIKNFNIEVHIMAQEPEELIDDYLAAGVKRLIVQFETVNNLDLILEKAKNKNVELMVSIIPDTDVRKLEPYFQKISDYQILAVHPGLAGQKFLPLNLEKIKFIRQNLPQAKIEVDGGINLEVAQLAKTAGADIIVSASYIFNNKNPRSAYWELVKSLS